VQGGEGECCPLCVIFSLYVGGGVSYFVLYLVFEFVNKAGGEIVALCNVEDGLPFSESSVIVEGEVEHPLHVVSVC
jgi:hypothetical protein